MSTNRSAKLKFPWKRNFWKIPAIIRSQLSKIEKGQIIVACVKKIPEAVILSGQYAHLGMKIESGQLKFFNRIIPQPNSGIYSRVNLEGKEVVLKKLPKVQKSWSWDSPNYGDWSKGSHTVIRDRQVYQRRYITPKQLELSIELLDTEISEQSRQFVLKFAVEEILERKEPNFQEDLLYNINLLQENVGRSSVFPAHTTRLEYLKTVVVEWEILPPGKKEEIIGKIIAGKSFTPEETRKIEDRYDLLAKLSPLAYIHGISGFHRYFGAKFSDDLVVFENIEYGNAMYVMYENWSELSKRSRIDLLKGDRQGFERIIHIGEWKRKLKALITRVTKQLKVKV